MGRPRKIKLETATQIHGKNDTFKPTTLDQIWGDTGLSKYKTLDLNTYLKQLDGMTKSDLQNEMVRVGGVPIDDMDRLKKRLIAEFNAHVNAYKIPAKKVTTAADMNPEVAKIMAEGK